MVCAGDAWSEPRDTVETRPAQRVGEQSLSRGRAASSATRSPTRWN